MKPCTPLLLLGPLLLCAGCRDSLSYAEKDLAKLKDPVPGPSLRAPEVLPLRAGTHWFMNAMVDRERVPEELLVVGPVRVGRESGIAVDHRRNGKPYRREVYRVNAKGISLISFSELGRAELIATPPVPLTGPDVSEGQTVTWKGSLSINGRPNRATSYSRVTRLETIRTPAGISSAYRVDSVITIAQPNAQPIHFPAIRWLAQGIGFVKRAYVDSGKNVLSDLERIEMR